MLVPAGRRVAVPSPKYEHTDPAGAKRSDVGAENPPAKPDQNGRSGCGAGRAGVMGGARVERPRQARKGRMTWGSVITAITAHLPEHRGHAKTSSSKTRRIKSAQHRTRSRRGARSWPRSWRSAATRGGVDGVGAGHSERSRTTVARHLAPGARTPW